MTEFFGSIVTAILEGLFQVTQWIGVPSYALAILLLTIILKIILHPTTLKQQKAAKAMQTLQPKIKAIDKKYSNNPEKKQEAMMKLYKDEKFSPFASCLPLLVQMPILLILFYGLRHFTPEASEYFRFLWISDLSMIVSATTYNMILPILCGLLTFVQQYLSMVNREDKTQRMLLFIMPVMFVFFVRNFPAALALYWLFYTLLSALQTLYINYKLKIGLFTSEEDKKKNRMNAAANLQEDKKANSEEAKKAAEKERKEADRIKKEKERDKKLPDKPWQTKENR